MERVAFQAKLCEGLESPVKDDEFRKIKKVLAPFMKTLKKRKRVKTDIVADQHHELYLKSSPNELLARLQSSYTDPLKLRTLMNETGELLKSVTKSKCFNLYLTDVEKGEILMISEYVNDNERFELRFPIEPGTYMAAYVAYSKEYVISSDILGDVRFSHGIPFAGTTVKAAIGIPIVTSVQGNCIGVIELYRDTSGPPYNLVNLQICSALTAWMGIAVEQNTARLNIAKEVDIHKSISLLSNLYFGRVLSFGKFLSDVLNILKACVHAEKGGFFVFTETVPLGSEDDLFADAYEEGFDEKQLNILYKKRTKVRFVNNEPGFPGYVARKGEIFNIRDAYKDSRFDKKNDTGFFRTRSMLCFPIKSSHGVVAVLKLVNKQDSSYFREEDINVLEPHLLDIGIVCQHYELDVANTKMNMKLIEAEALLDYAMKPSAEEHSLLKYLVQQESSFPPGFFKFEWDTIAFEEDSLKYIAYAILSDETLEPLFEFHTLLDFLLRIRKGHRPVMFHNFDHAFSVFHCIYLMYHKTKDKCTPMEAVTLILAALCHDVDHMGVTNSFLMLKNDLKFQLYEDICGEAHRFEVAMLSIQASNVLLKFSSENYQTITKNLRKLMISLDLSVHFQNRMQILHLLNADTFNWSNPDHRFLSMSMVLMCADKCFIFKHFENVKKFTTNFYKELQHQGDLERAMEFEPLPILDRSKSDSIPENQVLLTTIILIPVIDIVILLFPQLSMLKEMASQTLDKWKEILSMKGQEMWRMNQALVKDKRDKRNHRVSVSRSSSIRTFMSEK
ncbi:hypothetical protein RUM43_010313 [Polyplax serrata]|uniref:Phosphodiesterase n=1 Tax=Polyplax serrata TaxID=468196 RepID=A0AAN8PKD6_POLSC